MKSYLVLTILAITIPYCSLNVPNNAELETSQSSAKDSLMVLVEKQPGTDKISFKLVNTESAADSLMLAAEKNFDYLDSQSRKLNRKLDKYKYENYVGQYVSEMKASTNVQADNLPKTCIRPETRFLEIQDSIFQYYYNF